MKVLMVDQFLPNSVYVVELLTGNDSESNYESTV